jgi:hypothetical protein
VADGTRCAVEEARELEKDAAFRLDPEMDRELFDRVRRADEDDGMRPAVEEANAEILSEGNDTEI